MKTHNGLNTHAGACINGWEGWCDEQRVRINFSSSNNVVHKVYGYFNFSIFDVCARVWYAWVPSPLYNTRIYYIIIYIATVNTRHPNKLILYNMQTQKQMVQFLCFVSFVTYYYIKRWERVKTWMVRAKWYAAHAACGLATRSIRGVDRIQQ